MNSRILLAALLLLSSCDNITGRQSRGAIVLGDASTIVTEADPQYLKDMVPDPAFDESLAATPTRDTAIATAAPPKDTVASAPASAPTAAPVPAGLTADFGNVQVVLPGVEARGAKRSLRGASSAAFTLPDADFSGKKIVVSGGTVKRIQQRTGYSTVVDISGRPVLLSDLGTQYSSWQTLKGSDGQYTLAALSAPAFNASSTAIRNAVQKAARRQRLDRKAEQKLLSSARSVTSKPLSVVPRAFTWKIDGTDAAGKAFSKEVRIDVPL